MERDLDEIARLLTGDPVSTADDPDPEEEAARRDIPLAEVLAWRVLGRRRL
jgi:hypothetical protein